MRFLPFALCACWALLSIYGLKAGLQAGVSGLGRIFIPSAPSSAFGAEKLLSTLSFLVRGHLSSALVLAALAGAGGAFLAFIGRPAAAGALERGLVGVGLGFGALSLSVLGLGMSGLLFPSIGWFLAGACAIAAASALRRRAAFRVPGLKLGTLPGVLVLFLAAEALAALLLVFSAGAVPDPFPDSTIYQLAVPQLFIDHHKAVAVANNAYACFPLAAPMLSVLLWLVGGVAGPRAWCFWTACLVLLAVYNIGAREGRPAAGLAGAAMLAVVPVFAVNAMWSGSDLSLCFVTLLAAAAAREAAVRAGRRRLPWVLLSGLLLGTGLSAKYTAVFFAPWFFAACSAGRLRPGLKRAALFTAAAAVFVLPWLARNFAVTGNPVYPYATGLFPAGRQMDPARLELFKAQQSAGVYGGLADALRLPLLLSRGLDSETFIGPVFMALTPAIFLFAPPGAPFKIYAAFFVLAFLTWAPVSSIMRYLLAGWALLFALIACSAWQAEKILRGAAAAVLLVLLGAGFYNLGVSAAMWKKAFDPVNALLGREKPAEYLDRMIETPYAGFAFAAESAIPERGRVLIVGDPRSLYWPRKFISHSAYDVEVFEEIIRSSRSAAEAAKRLKQTGATHVFINDAETARVKFNFGYNVLEFDSARMKILGEFWRSWIRPVRRSRGLQLYELRRSPAAGPETPLPLSFDIEALQREYMGWTMMTWEGDTEMSFRKEGK